MIPIASVPATSTVARTNWVSERHATRPEESARERAARGKIRTTQAQMSCPSARKKYVENKMMKKPARMWLAIVPRSLARLARSLPWDWIQSWVFAMELSICESLACSGTGLEPVPDLAEAVGHLAGEVVDAGGDLLAHEREQQRDDREPADHDQERRQLAGHVAALHEADQRARSARR